MRCFTGDILRLSVAGVPSHEKFGGLGKSWEIIHDITNDERFSSAPNPKGYMGIRDNDHFPAQGGVTVSPFSDRS